MLFDIIPKCRGAVGPSTGLEVTIKNWGLANRFHRILKISELGVIADLEETVEMHEELSTAFPVEASLADHPRSVEAEIEAICEQSGESISKKVHFTYLPEGWFDMTDPALAESLCAYAEETSSHGYFISSDETIEDLYESLGSLSARDLEWGRFVFVCSPEQLFSFGDGTRIDAAICFLCFAIQRDLACCLMILGKDCLVGIGNPADEDADRASWNSKDIDSFNFYNPFDAMNEIPMTISMDRAYAQARRMMPRNQDAPPRILSFIPRRCA